MAKISNKLSAYAQLMRVDKPIGLLLLLWPTYWALWLASGGTPNSWLVVIFSLGVFLMRSAGCVVNDIADRKVDGSVKRTATRPLSVGSVSSYEAVMLFSFLTLCAAGLLLFLNQYTFYLAIAALSLTCLYPFSKRWFDCPQLILGCAFSFSILMAYAATNNAITFDALVLFALTLCWVVSYDTMYAMVDRDDDLKIGVRSSAILFGDNERLIIGFLQMLMVFLWFVLAYYCAFSWPFYLFLLLASLLFIYQQYLIFSRQREDCFKAFLNNHWYGCLMFLALYFR